MPPKKLVIKDDGTADFGALESVVSTQLAADAKYEQARCMLTHTAHSDAPHTHTRARARARAVPQPDPGHQGNPLDMLSCCRIFSPQAVWFRAEHCCVRVNLDVRGIRRNAMPFIRLLEATSVHTTCARILRRAAVSTTCSHTDTEHDVIFPLARVCTSCCADVVAMMWC
jgi:hypothetical protein